MNKKISNSSTIQAVVQTSVDNNGRVAKKAGRKKKPVLTKARFNFYLDKDIYEEALEISTAEGIALSNVVNDLLENYVAKHHKIK